MSYPPKIKSSHRGLLHKDLGIPQGEKIGEARLEAAKARAKRTHNTALMKRANFALNFNDHGHHGYVVSIRQHHSRPDYMSLEVAHGKRSSKNPDGSPRTDSYDDNGQPSIECHVDGADLLLLADGNPARPDHERLLPYLTVQRTATIDKKKLAAAFEHRRAELEREVELLGESDIPDEYASRLEELVGHGLSRRHAVASILGEMRTQYIAHALDTEFPLVSCVRGVHLRVD